MTAGNLPENSTYALEKLRGLLESDKLEPEGKLPTERALSDMFGVSRRAIRRALEVLETEGRIWRRQGSGTYAGQRPDDWSQHVGSLVAGTNLMEVMEVRLRIEPQLAQLAAMRAKPDDIERMYELTKKIFASGDADSRELWDGALHRLIAQSAGNQFFLTIFDVINHVRQDEAWQTIRELARSTNRTRPVTYAQHMAIIDAIAARDPMKAAEAMREHLLMLQESLIRVTSLDAQHPQKESADEFAEDLK
ncbi:FadR/GntR family transcriptional regulator [Rhizobium sp. CNPSo 3464]|uniref:FadR/GntR family transcriptional regulator n=1 Tax=Rhizobium sp. CNPSo 3464 TaxID=3021406 RepID=UPI00254CE0F7|nr:FadR/GntR family transcriptional regulator [Rhizobium sp. CNPSo 3464]MDK4740060.1 FadR/GntR family transcriptional regulator [Rhizobium sp. CNPSo 3464]